MAYTTPMTYSTSNHVDDRMTYPQAHYNTIKQLLRSTQDQSKVVANALSPNGSFKYIDRECAKYTQRKYTGFTKPHLIPNDRIRRPLNCFMVFSHLERKRVAEENPELHNADLSKILGKKWKGLSAAERQPYIDEAERIRILHTEIYPDYKYQPRRKGVGKRGQRKTDLDGHYDMKEELANTTTQASQHQATTEDDVKKPINLPINAESAPQALHITENISRLNSNEDDSFDSSKRQFRSHSNVKIERDDRTGEAKVLSEVRQTNVYYDVKKSGSTVDQHTNKYNYATLNPSSYLLTPDLSPVSCYKEPTYNTPINNGMHGIQSLPPTPEVSPKQIYREESVFNFEPTNFVSNEFVNSHSIKPSFPSTQQIHVNYGTNEAKEDYSSNYYYYAPNDYASQVPYYQENFQPDLIGPEYYQQNYPYGMNQMNQQNLMPNGFGNYDNANAL